MAITLKVPFGLKDNQLVEAAQLPSGKDMNCVCPGCGDVLVIHRGEKRRPHFKHYRKVPSQHCVETAIHKAAKQLIFTEKWIRVPEFLYMVQGKSNLQSIKLVKGLLPPGITLVFNNCRVEEKFDSVIPDILCEYKNSSGLPIGPLAIEIFVSNRTGREKQRKLRQLDLLTLEIDLSKNRGKTTFAELREIVLTNTHNKRWVNFPVPEALRLEFDTKLMRQIADDNRLHEEKRKALQENPSALAKELMRKGYLALKG